MENDTKRFHAFVKGFVQGVGFRFFVFQYGVNLNLNGWVRNRINGQVEVLAEGPKDTLDKLLEKLVKVRRWPTWKTLRSIGKNPRATCPLLPSSIRSNPYSSSSPLIIAALFQAGCPDSSASISFSS